MSTRSKPGVGRRSLRGGRQPGVAVVVLDDDRAVGRDQRVVGGARPGLEDRLRADQARSGHRLCPLVDDHLHRVGVVGDRHVVGAHHVGRGPRAGTGLTRLVDAGVRIHLAPRDGRRAAGAGVEPVERGVGDDVHAARLVHREGVRDLLTEVESADRAGGRVDRPDDTLLRDEPQPPRPVRQHREELVVDRRHAAQVVVALEREPGAERPGRLADHPDVPVVGRDHRAVEVVEVEVAAAGEVVERVAGARLTRRQRELREHVERVGVEHHEPRALQPHADRHDPARAVERHGGALGDLEGGQPLHVARRAARGPRRRPTCRRRRGCCSARSAP